jgi:hypothetical protein
MAQDSRSLQGLELCRGIWLASVILASLSDL